MRRWIAGRGSSSTTAIVSDAGEPRFHVCSMADMCAKVQRHCKVYDYPQDLRKDAGDLVFRQAELFEEARTN